MNAPVMFFDQQRLNPEFVTYAARAFRRWRKDEWQAGTVLTLGSMVDEIKRRWSELTFAQACLVIGEADMLDRTGGR